MNTERDPSLHIPRSVLRLLVHQWFFVNEIGKPAEDLVNHLLSHGVNYTLTHRKKLESYDNKTKKKTDRLKMSTVDAARDFAGLLKQARQQRQHRGITSIREAGKDWELIKECTSKAVAFCESYNLELRTGFITYINIYLDMLKNTRSQFSLQGLPRKHEAVVQTYEAQLIISEDKNSEDTERCHNLYSAKIVEKTSISYNYLSEPLKYVYFVYATELATHLGLSVDNFINAQFEGLAWTKGIPAPQQMVTKAAEERAVRWMAENGIKARSNKNDPNNMSKDAMAQFWKKIKQANEVNPD